MAVRGQSDPVRETGAQIVHEPHGAFAVPATDEIRDDELRVGFDRSPSPNVASAFRRGLRSAHVLLLRVYERPDFIDLNALGRHVANVRIMVGHTGAAGIRKQLRDRVLADARQTRNCTDRLAFAEEVKDASAVFGFELVYKLEYTALC